MHSEATMISKSQITGLILAGGQGSRIAYQDKGLVLFRDKPMVEHVIERFSPQVGQIVISANRNLADYATFGFPLVEDTMSNFQGPLAGIISGMQHATTPYLAVAPCDTPFLARDLVSRLSRNLQEKKADVAVPFDGKRTQPIFAFMKCSLLADLQKYLQQNNRKVDVFFKQHRYITVDYSTQTDSFLNMNTYTDLHAHS